jgi:putative PIN family toxin of toxin-antitoxin system
MRVVVDTNVLVSGVFFSGIPRRILEAWRDRRIVIVASLEILEEYRRVGERLGAQFEGVSLEPFFTLLATNALIVQPRQLSEAIVSDPADDKFFACALAADCRVIVSGDKRVLAASGYGGVEVLRPRGFVERYL